ncbi:uncharacterized protein LOC113372507 [Ctenocephalides felis]|uniref:uncharacterized protein LOC113372507 n=1 Tax=Ctenocephalides felis TaxID=7515 RepID=UPI000E6E1E4A|nr:uncharacterized protein LOC113372507 [Ctenocephalides felis]
MNFVGKVVLVTGASSGIGAATAVQLAKLGASLALTGRNVENLQKTANECNKSPNVFTVPGNLTSENDIKKIYTEVMNKFGKLDVLINNAGILENGTIETTNLEQYDRLMNTNVRSIYYLTMLSVQELIKTKGNIVNVSSVNGIRAFPNVLAYNMSKAAVDHFTRCAALELAAKGVRVNAVNPGVTITNLHRSGGMDETTYQKFLEHSRTTHAMGKPGEAIDVAEAIIYLASDAAKHVTGVTLPVDGGRHAMCPR